MKRTGWSRLILPIWTSLPMPRQGPPETSASPPRMSRALQLSEQMLKVPRRRTIDGNFLARARMNKRKMRGVQRDAVNQRLIGFLAMVFPVPDQRMPDGGKLRANLVLQSRDQLHAYERRIDESALCGIAKFSAGGIGISRRPQLLIHAFTPEIMHQRACFLPGPSAHHRQILPYRRMRQKLADQRVAITVRLGKQKDAGGKPVNAMDDQSALPSRLEFSDQQRQRRRDVGAFDRHSQQPGRLVEDNHSIVFIKYSHFALRTRLPARSALVMAAILPSFFSSARARGRFPDAASAARAAWRFLHLAGTDRQFIIRLRRLTSQIPARSDSVSV